MPSIAYVQSKLPSDTTSVVCAYSKLLQDTTSILNLCLLGIRFHGLPALRVCVTAACDTSTSEKHAPGILEHISYLMAFVDVC